MARRPKATPTEGGGNVTRASFLEFFDELTAALRLKASADNAVATVYKHAEQAGLNRRQMKRAYQDNLKDTDELKVDDRRYRLYMQWLGKPVGFQPDLGLAEPRAGPANEEEDPAEAEAVEKHQYNQAFDKGVYAGKAGANAAASNPFAPGTEEYASFSTGWGEGQRLAVEALGGATRRRRRAPDKEGAAV